MVPTSLAFLLSLWLLFFNLDLANSSDQDQVSQTNVQPSPPAACVDCTICPYPCHKLSPPAPLNSAPPPPPPSQQSSVYPIYGAPPAPKVQGNCPPGQVPCCGGVQCCAGTGTGTGTPPPTIYTYLPSDSYSALYHSTIPIFSIAILLVSFTVLF